MNSKLGGLRSEIIQQLLFSKWLLSRILVQQEAKTSPFSLAEKILIAHDAAEIGIAAVADQIGTLPNKNQRFLMDYFDPIKNQIHSDREVEGKEYCRQLNIVRRNIKHGMILPDPRQWTRVGDKVYSHLSEWCKSYLDISLYDLDNSILINNKKVKDLYGNAKKEFSAGNYKHVLELLAKALYLLFEENNALRELKVGIVKAEDAIKIAAFGVHANDFLALQEFLPQITQEDGEFFIKWEQQHFGHPGNWREDSSTFCMTTFIELALRIQDADWIPGAISFSAVYEYKIEAIKDNVEIWNEYNINGLLYDPEKKIWKKTLNKGESFRVFAVTREQKLALDSLIASNNVLQVNDKQPEKISVLSSDGKFHGYVFLQDVKITCIAKEDDFVKEYFPTLPTVDMDLD